MGLRGGQLSSLCTGLPEAACKSALTIRFLGANGNRGIQASLRSKDVQLFICSDSQQRRNLKLKSAGSPVVIAVVSLFCAAASHAAEKKISQSDLSAAVQKTAQEQSKGATVKGYTRDNENGQLEYEVEMTVNGHSKDVSIGPDGKLLEVEEQVEMGTLPSGVQSGLKAKAGKGKIPEDRIDHQAQNDRRV